MERRQFVKAASAVALVTCADCLIGCSKSAQEQNNSVTTEFSINLNSELLQLNDVIVKNNVRVVRIASGNFISSFTAVDQWCTHAGGNLAWVSAQNKFICPVHGSEFNSDGSLIVGSGPASRNLKKFTMQLNGSLLIVKFA